MKKLVTMCAMVAVLAAAGVANANVFTLEFSPNELLAYSSSDGTRLDQLGTARRFEYQTRADNLSPWGLAAEYTTYDDASYDRPVGQNATDDIANIASSYSACTAEYQGISQIQLWLRGGISRWGETIVQKPSAGQNLTISTGGAGGWTTGSQVQVDVDAGGYDSVVFNHNGNPATDPWLNGDNLMSETFSVTGDFYVDENGNGVYDAGDSDLVEGTKYVLWFYAPVNNCYFQDAYNPGSYINTGMENEKGAIEGTIPEPATMSLLGIGLLALIRRRRVR
jgi:PEP-CTERM motif-containing protein